MIPDPENRFTGLPFLGETWDGHEWIVRRKLTYRLADGRLSTVHPCFSFDWATIPRFLWSLIGAPTGGGHSDENYGIAAIWHDWLYVKGTIGGQFITRKQADQVFLEIMLYTGVKPILAKAMYQAVRLFGRGIWAKHDRNAE